MTAAGAAYLFALPLWFRAGGRPGLGKNLEASSKGVDQLTVFGLFIFLALALLVRLRATPAWPRAASEGLRAPWRGSSSRPRSCFWRFASRTCSCSSGCSSLSAAFFLLPEQKEDRLAFAFLATAFFLVLFAQRFYIVDRMNTFFKLYLEAWLLFALATAVLVFGRKDRRGAIDGWPLPVKAAAALLAVAALFTSVTAGRAAVSRHFGPYSGPSLDGMRYLAAQRPGEARAVEWLRGNVAGTPVVLEAQGPSYQEFGRISMLTGLPTVLGWDYHVKQRGNPEPEIEARKAAVKTIYGHADTAPALAALKRYRVGYVYVGPLERKSYPADGLKKFRENPELFPLVYENPEVQIYRVAGGPAQDVFLPVKEALPESSAPGPPEDEPEEKPTIASKPTGEPPWSNLREPRGAAFDGRGRVWVADFGNSRLRVFDRDGAPLGGWGGRGSGQFGFRELCGVTIRGDSLYVADTWNGRVQAYALGGGEGGGGDASAVLRATATDLYGPRGITVAADGRVWVSDTGNHRVLTYGPLLDDPKIVGKKGSGPGEFSSPIAIAASPSGEVFVGDTGNRRIQVFAPDGTFRRAIPFPGWGENVEPALAIDPDGSGTIYATDPAGSAVVVLDASGREKTRFTADENGRKLENPTGLAIDGKDRMLYVVNAGSSSIAKLRLPPGGAAPHGQGGTP